MNAEPSSSTRRRSRADTLEGPTERVGPGQLGEFRALLEAEPHYPVEGRLGEGGSAMVFLSSQPRIGRRVAIKSLKPEHRGPRAVQRLLQEAWVLGQVRHPNVVALHDVHLARDGFPRLVLERVVGVPWLDVIQRPDAHAARFGERG